MTFNHVGARGLVRGGLIALLAAAGLAVATPASAAVLEVTIEGTLTTADGTPVVFETIEFTSYFGLTPATTDEAGHFSTVEYYNPTSPSITYNVRGALSQVDPALLDGSPVVTLDLTVPSAITATIQGTVTDAYGVPVASTQMFADPASGPVAVFTDENGFYSMTVEVVQGSELWIYVYGTVPGEAHLSDFIAGGITPLDIVVGAGNVNTILIDGVVLAADGTPAAGVEGSIQTDWYWFDFITDESGMFSVPIEYGKSGDITIWTWSSRTYLNAEDLLGLETLSLEIQELAPRTVTFSGHVTDTDGNVLAHQPVAVDGGAFSGFFYTFTDESGFYSIEAVIHPFGSYTIVTDGIDEPYRGPDVSDGAHITVDLVSLGQSYEVGVLSQVLQCDVDGDGWEDSVEAYHMLTSDRNDWRIALSGPGRGYRAMSFGQGEIAETYCADLNGDGASELIARGETTKFHPKTGTTTVKHTWWIYEYATGTVTDATFGRGDLTVYFENLDDAPGVELIAVRPKDDAADKFWILDDPSSTIEVVKLGFHTEGTLAFEDVNDVPGVEIVTSITKPNGHVKVEYYTRAGGVGSIVKYTVK